MVHFLLMLYFIHDENLKLVSEILFCITTGIDKTDIELYRVYRRKQEEQLVLHNLIGRQQQRTCSASVIYSFRIAYGKFQKKETLAHAGQTLVRSIKVFLINFDKIFSSAFKFQILNEEWKLEATELKTVSIQRKDRRHSFRDEQVVIGFIEQTLYCHAGLGKQNLHFHFYAIKCCRERERRDGRRIKSILSTHDGNNDSVGAYRLLLFHSNLHFKVLFRHGRVRNQTDIKKSTSTIKLAVNKMLLKNNKYGNVRCLYAFHMVLRTQKEKSLVDCDSNVNVATARESCTRLINTV